MPALLGEHAAFHIDVVSRHIPEGVNSWENNWLQAEFTLLSGDSAVRFCSRRLTVHDVYDLYFHLGIALQGLSTTGVLIPMLQRQLRMKISPENDGFQVSLEMPGCDDLSYAVTRQSLAAFALELREVLRAFPLRAEEVPSVAPVIEFYSTKHMPERIQAPAGLRGKVRSLFKVPNPMGQGRGDAMRFIFTLSKPHNHMNNETIASFFSTRGYDVQWHGDVLMGARGASHLWHGLDGKQLPTQVELTPTDTHSILTIDVWTAGVRQNSRRLFAWVGEAAMLEVFLAGYKSLEYVGGRLAMMDSNLRRASLRDILRIVGVIAVLAAAVLLAL